MSAPVPPTPQQPSPYSSPPALDPVISFTHRLRDKFDLVLGAHRVVIVLLLCAFAFAGYEGWKWHVEKMARLESQASALTIAAKNQEALGAGWKKIALTRVERFRVDTVRKDSIVYRTKWFMAPVTVAAPDGTTSVVPMQVVAKEDFDSLGAMCERTQHDCASALAAKDSVIAHDSLQASALAKLNQNVGKQLTMQKHATIWAKVLWGIGGIILGRASKL
jgi:hypothetical protein